MTKEATSSDPPQLQAETTDPILHYLMSVVERRSSETSETGDGKISYNDGDGIRINITIVADGRLISGELVSSTVYAAELAASVSSGFLDSFRQAEIKFHPPADQSTVELFRNTIHKVLDENGDQYRLGLEKAIKDRVSSSLPGKYIHLRNAIFPGVVPVAPPSAQIWRIRTDRVTAVHLGLWPE